MTSDTDSFPDHITWGEKYDPAMAITDQDEADAYFDRLVEHTMRRRPELTRQHAEQIERANLGYWTGYHSRDAAERVERLFHTCHPILGPEAWQREYTPEQVFQMGMDFAERMKHARGEERTD